jgi:hypothetical protein
MDHKRSAIMNHTKHKEELHAQLQQLEDKQAELTQWLHDHPSADYKAWKKVSDDLRAVEVSIHTVTYKLKQVNSHLPVLGGWMPDPESWMNIRQATNQPRKYQ